MADRTIAAKISPSVYPDGANALSNAADGLLALNPTGAGYTVQPGSPLAAITIANSRTPGTGGLMVPASLGLATATTTPNTSTISGTTITPFMVDSYKPISNITMRVTAMAAASAVLQWALHRYDPDNNQFVLVRSFGVVAQTNTTSLAQVPNASGIYLTPGIIFGLVLNPALNASPSSNITVYAPRGTTYPTPLPLMAQSDPPTITDFTERSWNTSYVTNPTTTDPASATLSLAGAFGVTSPLYSFRFQS